jgi:hypothetical protein
VVALRARGDDVWSIAEQTAGITPCTLDLPSTDPDAG